MTGTEGKGSRTRGQQARALKIPYSRRSRHMAVIITALLLWLSALALWNMPQDMYPPAYFGEVEWWTEWRHPKRLALLLALLGALLLMPVLLLRALATGSAAARSGTLLAGAAAALMGANLVLSPPEAGVAAKAPAPVPVVTDFDVLRSCDASCFDGGGPSSQIPVEAVPVPAPTDGMPSS